MKNTVTVKESTKFALAILVSKGFVVSTGGGNYLNLKRKFNHDNLHVTLRGYDQYVSVYIDGIGIKLPRSTHYYLGDSNDESDKLIARLKRIIRTAENYNERQVQQVNKNKKIYDDIRDTLMSLGALTKTEKSTIRQTWSGQRATITINGYDMSVNADTETRITVGDEAKYINIEPAIQIVNLMPTRVPVEEDF